MSPEQEMSLALDLLRGEATFLADARAGAPLGNSIVGSLLSLQHQIPRQYAERAVVGALRVLDAEQAESKPLPIEDGGDPYGHHTLQRTGKTPLRFHGVVVVECDGQRWSGKERTRWHNLMLYRTSSGRWILHLAYRTRWQGELDLDEVHVLDQATEVAPQLAAYDPAAHVVGFPEGDAYAERQRRLLADLRNHYADQVRALLAELDKNGEPVAEEVP